MFPTFLDDQRVGADVVIVTHPILSPTLPPLVRLRESQAITSLSLHRPDLRRVQLRRGAAPSRSAASSRSRLCLQSKPSPSCSLAMPPSIRATIWVSAISILCPRASSNRGLQDRIRDWFTDFAQNGFATDLPADCPCARPPTPISSFPKSYATSTAVRRASWNSQALLHRRCRMSIPTSLLAANSAGPPLGYAAKSRRFCDSLDSAYRPLPDFCRSPIDVHSWSITTATAPSSQWSFADLFDTTRRRRALPTETLPVYLLMDVPQWFLQDVYAESSAESLLLAPNGGAVRVWAHRGFTSNSPQSHAEWRHFLHFLPASQINPSAPLSPRKAVPPTTMSVVLEPFW